MTIKTRQPTLSYARSKPTGPTPKLLSVDSEDYRALLEDPGVGICVVKILGTSTEQALFIDAIAPEGTVFFGSLGDPIDIVFTDQSPLVGVPNGTRIAPGPSVPFTVDSTARGQFPFTMSGPGLGRTFVIDVEPGVPTRALGFRAQPLADVILEAYAKSTRGDLLVVIENQTDGPSRVELVPFGGLRSDESLAVGEVKPVLYKFDVFGSVLLIRLDPELTVINQSGGTEQVEIILEPD